MLIFKSKKSRLVFQHITGHAKYTGTCILGMSLETFEINLGVGVIIKNFWHAAVNQNICSWCHCQGLPRPVSKHIAYSVYDSAYLDLILSCRVCDFLPKKYFHNSHFINHNLDHLISAPTTFHPPCNLSSALQFLTHPAIVSPTLHPGTRKIQQFNYKTHCTLTQQRSGQWTVNKGNKMDNQWKEKG